MTTVGGRLPSEHGGEWLLYLKSARMSLQRREEQVRHPEDLQWMNDGSMPPQPPSIRPEGETRVGGLGAQAQSHLLGVRGHTGCYHPSGLFHPSPSHPSSSPSFSPTPSHQSFLSSSLPSNCKCRPAGFKLALLMEKPLESESRLSRNSWGAER